MKDTRRQGCFHIGLFKHLRKVFHLSGTAGGNHRDGDTFIDVFHQLNIKAAIGAILINAVQEYFPCT